MAESSTINPLIWAAAACAAVSIGIIGWYLLRHPPFDRATKILLFAGLAVFPIGTSLSGNVVGYTTSQERAFCSSCHVMTPYTDDSDDPKSTTLAATHARSPWFGHHNCYTCHTDYGMFGTVSTKISGLNHVWEYVTHYRDMPLSESRTAIALYRPFSNAACLRCHSTKIEGFAAVPDHRGIDEDVRTDRVSCASGGCHGPAHPFSKPEEAMSKPKGEP